MLSHKDSNNSISDNDIDNNFNTTEDASNISNNQRSTKTTVSEKKSFLYKFLNTLPKLESHYFRANTSKLYLEPNWTSKTDLYNFYCNDYCTTHNTTPMSIYVFCKAIEEQNIGLFQPKKDACDICTAFDTGNLSQEEKEHDSMKKEARMEKKEQNVRK